MSGILSPEQAARLAEAFRPTTEALAAFAEQMEATLRPLREGLVRLPTPPTLPPEVLARFRRWASLSPRQRARALLAEVHRLVRARAAALASAISRHLGNLAALVLPPGRVRVDSAPEHGPPLALVLLDSTRPVHGPPLPA